MKLPQLTRVQQITVLVLGSALILGGLAFVSARNRATTATQTPTLDYAVLDTRVVWTEEAFRIVNLENRSWLHCEFVLNTQYRFIREKVQPREVLQIAHTLFEDSQGMSYVYAAEKPNSFTIRCENVGGRVGLFSGSYTTTTSVQ